MSTTDQNADVVQPEEGQGDGGQGAAPYQEWLDRIPEEARAEVEPVFKEWDANVTRRFQENAERQSAWEPYEQLGVQNVPAEEVQQLLQFREALGSPEVIRDWYEQTYAPANGLTPAQAEQQQEQPSVDDFFQSDEDRIAKLVEERLSPVQQQLEQITSWREQQEYGSRLAEAERFVEGQLSKLEADNPGTFDRALVERLVPQYVESDPQNAVQRAFQDSLAIRGQIEKGYIEGKANAPAPAESGGVANAAPDEIKTFPQAREAALQMLRDSKQ